MWYLAPGLAEPEIAITAPKPDRQKSEQMFESTGMRREACIDYLRQVRGIDQLELAGRYDVWNMTEIRRRRARTIGVTLAVTLI